MDHASFSTLIVTYNSEDVITNLLSDLYRINPDGQVTVIDNASSDHTVSIIRTEYPQVAVAQNTQNIGYGRAVNQGVDICSTPFILILNPDIRIPNQEAIEQMADYLAATPSAAAVGPLQYMEDQSGLQLNFISSYWGWKAFTGYFYYRSQQRWPNHKPIKVPFLNAGCFVMRRSAFNQVGKLNPKYFLYGEEPDLGLKFINYGYDSWLLPGVYVIHFRERSLRKLPAQHLRKIRWQARLNILDALFMGTSRIMLDKITFRQKNRRNILEAADNNGGENDHYEE